MTAWKPVRPLINTAKGLPFVERKNTYRCLLMSGTPPLGTECTREWNRQSSHRIHHLDSHRDVPSLRPSRHTEKVVTGYVKCETKALKMNEVAERGAGATLCWLNLKLSHLRRYLPIISPLALGLWWVNAKMYSFFFTFLLTGNSIFYNIRKRPPLFSTKHWSLSLMYYSGWGND